ncbi:hypothetical protein [Polyangium spumosum]|uniref:Redoxin domain-containing protein n=1 Tax=Polyangium spumosum TaxID=889282 RepID=A0A6N7PYP7_9BACT|nr:hypothetical protein [Polyangium spumosum]MRG95405.1 hypothetical protein [Polyangium spumosum]
MSRTKKVLVSVAALLVAAGAVVVGWIGPRNVIGMLRYDQREEGRLAVGDAAPDVELVSLGEGRREKLSAYIGEKPLVLIFGSFT